MQFLKFFLSFFFYFTVIYSQANKKFYIEAKYQNGKLVKHTSHIEPLIKGNIEIAELNIVFPCSNNKEWIQLYRFPELGIGYQFGFLKYPEVLGYANTIFSFIRIPLIKTKPVELKYQLGLGPSYFNKIYNPSTNPINRAIGSHLNLYLNVSLLLSIRLSNNLFIIGGYGLNHYSIGSLVQPNLGLNVNAKYIALQYSFNKNPIIYEKKQVERKHCVHEIWGYYAPGFKEIDLDIGQKYFTSTLSVNYYLKINAKRKIGFGFEYFYDKSLQIILEKEKIEEIYQRDMFRPGLNIGHELIFNKVSFLTQLGTYIYSKSSRFGYIYYRGGIKYHFCKNFFVILALKAHYPANADFVEWGIGYSFKKQSKRKGIFNL